MTWCVKTLVTSSLRPRSRRFVAAALGTLVLATVATAVPASAAAPAAVTPPSVTAPPRPPTIPAAIWNELWGPTAAGWSPTGTVVADTGFRPWPNGFSFFNWGATAAPNNFLTASNATPAGMTAADLRTMFGDGVCAGFFRGQCRLTPVAENVLTELNAQGDGGHCYGLAALSARIYDGRESTLTYGATGLPAAAVPFAAASQRSITYWFTTQFGLNLSTYLDTTPQAIVQQMSGVRSGTAPYVMVLMWDTPTSRGGHAIVPYALYDKGNGKYDIAVYDNNYPNRERAVHVDTVANTWEYLVSTNPQNGPLVVGGTATSGTLGLVPIGAITKKQDCTFCSSGTTTVRASSVRQSDPVTVSVVGLDGKAVPGLETVRPLAPPTNGRMASNGYEVPKGVPFQVVLDGRKLTRWERMDVRAVTNDRTVGADRVVVLPGQVSRIVVRPDATPSVRYTSNRVAVTTATLTAGLERPGDDVSVKVSGVDLRGTAPASLSVSRRTGTLRNDSRVATTVNVVVEAYGSHAGQRRGAAAVRVPGHGRLVVSYDRWLSRRGPLVATTVAADGSRTRVVLRTLR